MVPQLQTHSFLGVYVFWESYSFPEWSIEDDYHCGEHIVHGESWGRLEVGWEKVACWSTKVAISLKRVKIEEKLLCRAYRKSPTLFQTVPSLIPYGLCFPKIGGSQASPKTSIAIISVTGKATDFKFGRYTRRVHPNQCPLKILDKRECGHIQGLPQFFEYPILSQEWVKLRTSNFVPLYAHS